MIAELAFVELSVLGCRSKFHSSSTLQSYILTDTQWGSSWSRVRLSLCVGRNFGDIHQSGRVGIYVNPSSIYRPCVWAYFIRLGLPQLVANTIGFRCWLLNIAKSFSVT